MAFVSRHCQKKPVLVLLPCAPFQVMECLLPTHTLTVACMYLAERIDDDFQFLDDIAFDDCLDSSTGSCSIAYE